MLDKTARYTRLGYNSDGDIELTFTLSKTFKNEVLNAVNIMAQMVLGGKDMLKLIVKPYRKARSLNANAYYWKILDELANVLRTSKENLHIDMLTKYGQTADDGEGNKLIFSLKSHIKPTGILGYSALIGSTTLNGDEFNHYRALKGSSEMDSREMAILIDGLVSEAKEQGIETMTPQELSLMCEEWNK